MERNAVDSRAGIYTEISARGPNGYFARVLVDESTGLVVVVGERFTWHYWWHGSRGQALLAFLAESDSFYLGGKFLGVNINVFDPVATAERVSSRLESLIESG